MGGFYLGLVVGIASVGWTLATGDRALAGWGVWPGAAAVTWAILLHVVVLALALALVAAVVLAASLLVRTPLGSNAFAFCVVALVASMVWIGSRRSTLVVLASADEPGFLLTMAAIAGIALLVGASVAALSLLIWKGLVRLLPRVAAAWRVRPVLLVFAAMTFAIIGFVDARSVQRPAPFTRAASGDAPLNVVLIVVDALRADRLGSYGYAKPTSPHIDALARRGVLFERAVAQYPATGPSFGSLFTGKYPRRHGLSGMDPRIWLGGDFNQTLAEILAADGYQTAAILTGSLTRSSGLARGFAWLFEEMPAYDTYDVRSPLQTLRSRLPISRVSVRLRRALEPQLVRAEAERWLARPRSAPFFLFLHLYDTHAPYEPAREYVDLVEPDGTPSRPISAPELRALARHGDALPPDEVRRLNALYDAEVRSADDAVGRIVETLTRLGLADDTVIVLTADHGEELYEHRKLEHGHIFNTNLLVPLIVAAPGRVGAGTRIESPVELIDVLPTLLTMVGAPVPNGIDGTPLPLDGTHASVDGETYAFAESDCGPAGGAQCLLAVQNRRWKLTLNPARGARELFDLDGDPFEHANVAAQHPDVAAQLESVLRAWDRGQPDLASLQKAMAGAEVSEEIRERLRQLGYIE